MENCIVLNANYEYINTINWQKAIKLMVKGKAEVLRYTDRTITNFEKTVIMKIPLVMKLIKLIRTIYKTKVPFSKKNVLIRDGFRCAYCGVKRNRLTIDHVIPVSRGGKSTFENCVAACKECNSKKGDKLPSDVKMYLKKQPFAPTINQFLKIKMEKLGIDKIIEEMWSK